jgi:hypothetical protein
MEANPSTAHMFIVPIAGGGVFLYSGHTLPWKNESSGREMAGPESFRNTQRGSVLDLSQIDRTDLTPINSHQCLNVTAI